VRVLAGGGSWGWHASVVMATFERVFTFNFPILPHYGEPTGLDVMRVVFHKMHDLDQIQSFQFRVNEPPCDGLYQKNPLKALKNLSLEQCSNKDSMQFFYAFGLKTSFF